MAIIKWRPLFNDMEEFIERPFRVNGLDLAVDLYEEGNNVIAKMNVPGIDADNIKVEVHDTHLHISGKREEKEEEKGKDYYRKEIRCGSFERVVSLPCAVHEAGVIAELSDGVLKITMPKSVKEEEKIKTIKVVRK